MPEVKCPYFRNCSGCSLQHIDYLTQIEKKKKTVSDLISFNDVSLHSDMPYGYRNKMEFFFLQRSLGLRSKENNSKLIPIEHCDISNERINILLKELNSFFKTNDSYSLSSKKGTLYSAVIRASTIESAIVFNLNEDSGKLSFAIDQIKQFAENSTAKHIIIAYVTSQGEDTYESFVVKGEENLKEVYLGKNFIYSAVAFFQNNYKMAEKMQIYCNELLKKSDYKNYSLLDLYAGVGTFGIINAELFKEVYIVESVEQAIEAAKINIEQNNITNAKAILADAKNLKKLKLVQGGKYVVILDPPRSGMDMKTIEELNLIRPEKIIYISCNHMQLAKDIPKFKDYKITSCAVFDLFPQTNHIETVVELDKVKYNAGN